MLECRQCGEERIRLNLFDVCFVVNPCPEYVAFGPGPSTSEEMERRRSASLEVFGDVGGFDHATPVGEGLGSRVLGGVCAEGLLLNIEVARDEACTREVGVLGGGFFPAAQWFLQRAWLRRWGAKHLARLFEQLVARHPRTYPPLGAVTTGAISESFLKFQRSCCRRGEDDVRAELCEFLVGGAIGFGITGDVVQTLPISLSLASNQSVESLEF